MNGATRIFIQAGILATFAWVVVAVLVLYWSIFPLKTFEYLNAPFPVKGETALRHGDIIRYEVEYCRYVVEPVDVTRELIGEGVIITLPSVSSRFPKGCDNTIVARDKIPEHVPPGEYILSQTVTAKLNPIRTYNLTVDTESFEVLGE